jgi:hypothetical protein
MDQEFQCCANLLSARKIYSMAVWTEALYPQKLALTSPTSGGRSIGMVRSRTQATEFSLVLV